MTRLRTIIACVLIAFTALPVSAQTSDDIATCADLRQTDNFSIQGNINFLTDDFSCSIDWVENGRHRAVIWTSYSDEMVTSAFTYAEPGGDFVKSQRPPMVYDVNQDGSRDLVVFTLLGMVNGQYDVYLFEPETGSYLRPTPIFASEIYHDASGMLVAQSRNGARAFFDFYEMTDHAITPVLAIDAQDKCQIQARGTRAPWTGKIEDLPEFMRFDPEMIDYYCNIYDQTEAANVARSSPFEPETPVQNVPRDAIFYCQLENGNAAIVTSNAQRSVYTYTYGMIDSLPDLELRRERSESTSRSTHDAQSGLIREELVLDNGDYAYVPYVESRPTPNGPDIKIHGLRVTQLGVAEPIFDKTCIPEMSFDHLLSQNRS